MRKQRRRAARPQDGATSAPEPESRISVWSDTAVLTRPAALAENLTADVCIVGGGIAGITAAYLMLREGLSVVLLDDGPVGGGQTRRTSGHLCSSIDDRYFEIERVHGVQASRLAAGSHTSAIDRIETIIGEEEIECDFSRVDGHLFAATPEDVKVLQREHDAARGAGLDVDYLKVTPSTSFGPSLRFRHQGQFHPLQYLQGVAAGAMRMGGRLFGSTHVAEVRGGPNAQVKTADGHTVSVGSVIVATNVPVNNLISPHLKQAAYMTYVIGVRVPKDSIPQALYWDTGHPYHYVRLLAQPKADLLIVGGEDHKTGQETDGVERFAKLEEWTLAHFPQAMAIRYRWSGQVMETMDGLAFIGRNPGDERNVYIATGDSGMGLTHGTIAGILLTDLLLERPNPWKAIYDPSRIPLRALGKAVHEDVNMALQFGDWLTPGEVSNVDEIRADSGAILRRGVSKLAVYRDITGQLSARSAICPHLGCLVHWNDAEKTWDCPCHGSRFDRSGKVINGPANTQLAVVELPGNDPKNT